MRSIGETVAQAKGLGPHEAELLLGRAIEEARADGTSDSDLATLLVHHAASAERQERYVDAEARLREAFERFDRAHGPGDPRTAHAFSSIGRVRRGAGNLTGALEIYESILAHREGPRDLWLLIVEELRRAIGDEDGAARAMDEALVASRTDALADPMVRSGTVVRAARALVAHGRVADAVALLESAIAGVDAIERGERISPSARVPAQVRAELVAVLAELTPRDR